MFRFELSNSKAVFNILNKFETWFLKAEASFFSCACFVISELSRTQSRYRQRYCSERRSIAEASFVANCYYILPRRLDRLYWYGHGGVVKIRMFFTNKLPGRKYSG